MKTLCVVVVALFCIVSPLNADEPQAPASMEIMMQQMIKLGIPGEEHQMLAKFVGQWDCEVTEYPMFPGMEKTVSKGEAEFESKMGGRVIEQEFESEFNGMEYEGVGFLGYDKGKQVYYSTWMDNMSTQFMYAEGTYDESTNTITEKCETHCPLGEMKNKMVTKLKSDDEFVFEMYGQLDGQPEMKKMMQIVYTRK